ncbi:MAG: UDP-2,3-diacylglucosamine diphosphatase LpxI, partial [Pseudomonadota bacterium]
QDVAQACIVARGQCLGIETIYGTDALLADVARHRDDRQPSHGGVMVKRPKVGQEMRVDMPVIGPQTVVAAAGARLTGIHLAAEQVMVLEAAEVVETANRLEIAIWAS